MTHPSFTKTCRKTTYPAIDPTRPELSAQGKTVIITGAGAGSIGSHVALSFAKAGSTKIALVGRTEKTLRETQAKIEEAYPGVSVLTAVADVSEAESIGGASHIIRVTLGAWDVFVNGAAYLPPLTTITGADEDHWWKAFEVTCKSSHLFAKHFLSKCRPNATYISLNAGSSHIPASYLSKASAYSSSKLAAAKLDEFLALENPTLRVFTVHPGMVDTRLYQTIVKHQTDLPTGLELDDVSLPADFCVWLSSGEADFLRGRFLWVNWDVEELMIRKVDVDADPSLFRIQIGGWPFK